MKWFDKEEEELCNQLNSGEVTEKEFRSEMRMLRAEIQAEANQAAEEAYNDTMGYY